MSSEKKLLNFKNKDMRSSRFRLTGETFEKTRGFNQVLGWLGKIDCENYLVMRQNKGRF